MNQAPPRPLDGLRFLVVEEDAVQTLMIEDIIEDLGGAVAASAATLEQALAIVARGASTLDGAILDVHIGRETIYPVARALRSSRVPMIFVTGAAPREIERAYADVPVLFKPFAPEALERALRAQFAGRTS
jgi:CheY-like chemotaxis protein